MSYARTDPSTTSSPIAIEDFTEDWQVKSLGYQAAFPCSLDGSRFLPAETPKWRRDQFSFDPEDAIDKHKHDLNLPANCEYDGVLSLCNGQWFQFSFERKPSTALLNRIKKTVLTLLDRELKQRIHDECHTCPTCGNFSEQSLIAVEMCDVCAPQFRKRKKPQHSV